MADNFLEKQMEAYRSGAARTVVRRSTPSVETLVTKATAPESDPAYVVKQAQLDAIIRPGKAFLEAEGYQQAEFTSDEPSASVCLELSDSLALGEAVGIMRLKAADLGLSSRIESQTTDSATIKFTK